MMPDWRTIFGHDEPYDEQRDGIETAIETARDDGFTVIEGACGTGKTMLALTAGLDLVRDPDSQYERVFVLTSVKQQLRQFETDLKTINSNLPDDWNPISALTLVGKADVCPYSRENAGDIDSQSVYDRCEGLRERTRDLTGEGGSVTAQNLASQARTQQTGLADSGKGGAAASYLETAGEPTPYPPRMPEYNDVEYCPFYAQFLEDMPEDGDPIEAVPFDFESMGLIEPDDLVANSVQWGTCPHSMMGALLGHVEVVVGNYYHAFDPVTAATFTGALVDDSTFLVCDEAHMLEPRVRDLVSQSVGDSTLRDAESELTRVIQPVKFDDDDSGHMTADADLVRAELEDASVTLFELEETREFIGELREEIDRRVRKHLEREHKGWRANITDLPDEEIPLRDPTVPQQDEISEWAENRGYNGGTWARAEAVGAVVARILNEAEDDDRERAALPAGRALGEWYRNDHEKYFREIVLERTWNDREPNDSWRRAYNAQLAMQNCVPSDAIGEELGKFGGGILMSATLEPIEIFEEVSGLGHLEKDGRPIVERTYGLNFPESNRESFAVDAPKFTYDNRGAPGDETGTRQVYADAIRDVARSPGNVLVGMPNYAEATWAAEHLRSTVDKPVLLDESSADEATENLKDEFFGGEAKVLVTSLRGTLTEGVDYRGDRLRAAVVCGVPIINTASPRTKAVRTAYERQFGDGFTYALTVPAVRKARQALGRVIRGPDERGIRVLVDGRYARESWNSVREFFPPVEREEFQPVSPDMLSFGLERFWDDD
ncbi:MULTISPECIES: ATP-dependent DNA helicase [unclassified Haladaptatus]|uniref:ATP-dependent DNA helicase n=1 Tax=unclassified Haladaptatus TaxID=2622732 RepID=UPI00209BED9A|nr:MULTISPECIES: ATP-dependent DNA helicase [unclassified Haladaptatus]MCO8242702.1 ATP-dependent DNA helicase [Haladaptatus sp. AB643]MCO8252461.1 ATP-dependent DNA helicase [Haladaptatus sp. AB618]